MHICIIGAGVIGATSAYYLVQSGYRVTLIEGADHPAAGASFANGGQLSYSYVAPLAGPGVLSDALRWLLWPDSPLRLRPQLDPEQWRWLLNFTLACSAARSRETTTELFALAQTSRDALHTLMSEHTLAFHHQKNGKLIVHRQAGAFEAAKKQVEYQKSLGVPQTVLNTEACIALEPELQSSQDSLLGGVYTDSEEVGDCHAFTTSLIQTLQNNPKFTLCLNHPVQSLKTEGDRVLALRTAHNDIEADAFVVAAGMGSTELLKPLGVRLPLQPLKGYSLSVPTYDAGLHLSVSVTDYARRIVYANLGSTLRIAGLVEIGSNSPTPDKQSIAKLIRHSTEGFPQLKLNHAQPWAGLRPATAQGKPIIDRAPGYNNLWLNIGQGALGFTLACGSACLLAARLTGLPPPVEPNAFAYKNVR